MSSSTDGNGKKDDHSAYAPKWVRDSNRETSHESPSIGEDKFHQRSEQSFSENDPADQARAHRPLDTTFTRDARLTPRAWSRRAESELPEGDDEPPLHTPRSLQPEFLKERPPARRALGRLAAVAGLIIAASVGAAIALFATGKFPSELNPRPISEDVSRLTSARSATERAPTIRGVTDKEIRLGISAPFTGSAKELGNQMKLGIQTAFNVINDGGGIHGRQLRLIAADDGYEPTRTAETMKELYEKEQVFGFIGNVGTPTAVVALPYALERRTLFFGAFTGAGLLRRDPPDRYVFNYRASYAEETDAVVRYLVKMRGVRPEQIAVFAQQDAYGDSGFAGVAKAMRVLRGGNEGAILRLDYKRNTLDVDDAVARLRAHRIPIKAVVMVGAYRSCAKFIEKTRDVYPGMIYTNVSFVGSTALADELMLLGPRYANGVIVTQVVPAVDSYASAILKYKTALAKYFPGVLPDYVSLEGYVAGGLMLEGLKRAGRQLDTEKLVEALETVRDFDMGLGASISFGPTEHQGSHKVWGTQLNENGRYQAIDLE
jgi:ABC-type branched-subunit amino acid transport system substrate-binding protein